MHGVGWEGSRKDHLEPSNINSKTETKSKQHLRRYKKKVVVTGGSMLNIISEKGLRMSHKVSQKL